MATVSITCLCGREVTLDSALAGNTFPCPTCNRSLVVPRDDEPALAPESLATTIAAPVKEIQYPRRRVPAWVVIGGIGLAAVMALMITPHVVQSWHERRVAKLDDEKRDLPKQRQERQQELERQARNGQTQLTVVGPAALQAGATNIYQIEAKTLAGDDAEAKFTLRLLDKAGKEIAKQEREAKGKFPYAVPLPAALKPEDQLTLEVTAVRSVDGQAVTLSEKLPLERAGFVTHVTTDKPLYQPGEVVAFRSLTLDRFKLQAVEEDLQLSFTIADPAGQVIFRRDGSGYVRDPTESGRLLEGPDNRSIRGVGFGEFAIPGNAPGGEYVLSVSELRGRFAPQTRKFLVNRYQAPRLHKELEFTRRSYGPGDEVVAAARAVRIEGGKPLAGASVTVSAVIDGERVEVPAAKADAEGGVAVRFKLPKKLDTGEGTLSIAFNDGGNTETIVRPIPIVVRRLRVDFYPEGGDLIAGVANRVYFAARTPLGKPAEVRGRVLDSKGATVVEIRTLGDEKIVEANQGLGVFTFTPAAGQKYELQIDSPAGIPYKAELPDVKATGVVLRVDAGAGSSAEPIKASVASAGGRRRLLVAAYCRGRLVGSESIEVNVGETKPLTINPAAGSGVFRVTVFEEQSATRMVPVAERLIFRHPANYLNVAVQPDKSSYVPGEKVRLAVSAKDESGKPAGAIALVQVVDKAAFSLADDKTLRAMPTHFLLAGEVRRPEELENADFLLGDHPLASVTVDLLLGTQGWRRFAEQDPEKFRKEHKSDAERLLASAGQMPLQVTNRREAEAAAAPHMAAAAQKANAEYLPKITELDTAATAARRSVADWRENAEVCLRFGLIGLVLVVIAAGIAAAISGAVALEQRQPGSGALLIIAGGVSALVLGFLCILVVFVLSRVSDSPKRAVADADYSRFPPNAAAQSRPTAEFGGGGAAEGMDGGNMKMPAEKKPAGPGMPGAGGGTMGIAQGGDGGGGAAPPMPGGFGGGGGPTGGAPPPLAAPGNLSRPEDAVSPTDPAYATANKSAPGESARRRFDRVLQEQRRPAANQPAAPAEWSFKEMERGNRSLVARNAAEPFVVREYAHENAPGRSTRSDFTETVFWHPVLVLPSDKDTFVSFSLSDAVTSYQAVAYLHTPDGRLGAAKLEFAAKLPFSLDAKLPIEITNTDELHVPLAVSNDTDRRRSVTVTADARGLTRLDGSAESEFGLEPNRRARATFRYKPSVTSGEARLILSGRSDLLTDRVERSINVVPEGFPVIGSASGTLSRELTGKLVLPEQVTPGSLKVRAEVYPSLLADLLTGIDGMLHEPHGCFEQTSSSSYPNLLVLEYLQNTAQSRPEVTRRAMDLLERGYQRLLTFECRRYDGTRQGYEWFGGPVPHEALTAYGLLQFHDLARVYDKVDPAMVERTRKFLLSRRDGQGNFLREQNYHSFGRISQAGFNAYIVWALCESEADADLNREVSHLITVAESNSDPYFLALVANSLFLRNDKANGAKLLDKLTTLQNADGALPGRESIVGSYGRDLSIEATALTVLAWLKAEQPLKYREPLQKAVRWLTAQRGGYGGFGSTQATILTLKALSRLARDSKRLSDASVILTLNGDRILQKPVAASATDTLVLELSERDLAKLKPGANAIRLELAGEGELPAKISWSYQTIQPPSAADCPIKLSTKLDKDKVTEGDTVRLTAVIENTAKESQSMTVAIIGLPAGLSLPEDLKQLSDLAKPRVPLAGGETPREGVVSYFEVRGREVVLYWRGLAAGQRVEVPIDLVARTPGNYRGPASRAYLYYGADAKSWVTPLSAAITAR